MAQVAGTAVGDLELGLLVRRSVTRVALLFGFLVACNTNGDAPPPGPDGPSVDARPSGGGATCGQPNECICPAASTCTHDCLPGIACDMQCLPGSSCTTACEAPANCDVECASTTSCSVDCDNSTCQVSCPASGCTVTNCAVGTCTVTCGAAGTPTRNGTTATCP